MTLTLHDTAYTCRDLIPEHILIKQGTGELNGGLIYVLWMLGCATVSAPYCRCLFSDKLAPSAVFGSKKTSVLAVIAGMYGIKLAVSGAAGSRETNILAMIPGMHGIKSTLSSVADSRDTSILAMILVMHR